MSCNRSFLLCAIGVASAIFIGYMMGRTARKGAGEALKPKVDTLVIHDTIKVTEAISVTKKVVDSIPYPVTDTIRMRDTLFVYLEKEQIRWEDSLAVVYASGINPQVDSVIHYRDQLIITKEIPVIQVKKTRWGIGFQAGATADKNGVIPYVGLGVSYNILSW